MERVDGRETGYMNETSLITGFQVPRQHCGEDRFGEIMSGCLFYQHR